MDGKSYRGIKKRFINLVSLGSTSSLVRAQGCVAIRQFSGVGNALNQGEFPQKGDFNLGANYRYFNLFDTLKASTKSLTA